MSSADPKPDAGEWKILVVDDDPQVHQVTSLALSRLKVKGKSIRLIAASRVDETIRILEKERNLAVVILDVVMEEDTSGLYLVRYIREELKNQSMRIILRTGHPGNAPEIDVIQELDINDYRMKSELTRTKLITSVTTAIRSYDQLQIIQRNTTALESIVQSGSQSFARREFESYARTLFVLLPKIVEDLQYSEIGLITKDRNYQRIESFPSDSPIVPCDDVVEQGIFFSGPKVWLKFPADPGTFFLMKIVSNNDIDHQCEQLLRVLYSNGLVGFENLGLVKRLENSAYFDDLTGLPNKTRFLEGIEKNALGAKPPWTIGIIDIDDFSELNDTLGHENGNALLCQVAERLVSNLSPEIEVCRIAGDTFGLLGPSSSIQPSRLFSILDGPFHIGLSSHSLRVTIGFVASDGLVRCEDGITFANIAMKAAKAQNRGRFMWFTTQMRESLLHRISLSRELRPGLENNEFVLFFQPQVAISSRRLIGAESLVRWIRPGGVIVPPDEFIQLAENSGFIHEMGRWVFAEACKTRLAWAENPAIPSDARIGVNISVKQFQHPNFFSFLQQVLTRTGVNPDQIEIEITESFVMQDAEIMIEYLHRLKTLGMGIAIDDFGTGFSSLNYLLRLPIDKLKIDRSFIMNMMSDSRSISLTELVINLSKLLGLKVIAEGVESDEQAQTLVGLGCDLAQGFYYGRPMDNESFLQWIHKQ